MANEIIFSEEEGQVIVARPRPSGVTSWGTDSAVEHADAITSWDRVMLAGVPLPGLAQVRGSVKRRTDKKRAAGKNGARVTHLGWDASEFKVVLRLWTDEHLKDFEKAVKVFKPKSGAPPKAHDIYHPGLALFGISSVQVTEVGFLERVGPQQYETTIGCIEFTGAGRKTKVNTPKAAEPSITDFKVAVQRPPAPSSSAAVTGPTGTGS